MLLVVLLVALGCGSERSDLGDLLQVVATTPQVADFVRNVGGDDVRVHQVLKVGVDPHEYEPSPADQEAIRASKVIFENGVGLESWVTKAVEAAGSKAPVVDTSNGVVLRVSGSGEQDPHIWHNPLNVKVMVANIEAGLRTAAPERAGRFRQRSASYLEEVSALDAEVRRMVDSIPPMQRKLVTNHDALGYFADHYGLTVVGAVIPSFDSQAELSSRDLAALVARIKAENVKAIFAESSLPSKTAQTVSSDAGVRIVAGEDSLYADSMGTRGTAGETYLSMMRHNAGVLASNLA